jgi:hypothetical protein
MNTSSHNSTPDGDLGKHDTEFFKENRADGVNLEDAQNDLLHAGKAESKARKVCKPFYEYHQPEKARIF